MKTYYRAVPMCDPMRPANAQNIAGGWCWFDRAEKISRNGQSELVAIDEIDADVLQCITSPRPTIAGLTFERPRLMGILNVTPDSFSDGGRFSNRDDAVKHATEMVRQGADILDIGGESTRPGADYVNINDEILRTAPVISTIRKQLDVPISIDTRKSAVAKAALDAGADLINDVAAFTHDPTLMHLVAQTNTPVCLMHAQGDPKTMQDTPSYDNVLLDVYDFLEGKIKLAEAAGISRDRIVIDPGIGFGKTDQHNLTLLANISLFHSLGCAILLGASRKKFIGDITGEKSAKDRVSGSVAVAQIAASQGVQLLRVHDIKETKQAIAMQKAIITKRG